MRRVHLFFCLGGIAVLASTAFVLRPVQPPAGDATLDTVSVKAGEQAGLSASAGLATPPPPVSNDGAREAVPEVQTEDPCASVASELSLERARRVAAEQENAKLRELLAQCHRELRALRFPEDTPYGAFLASAEAEEITANIKSGGHLYAALLDKLRDDVQRHQAQVARDPSAHNAHLLKVASERLQQLTDDREAAVSRVLSDVKARLDEFPLMLRPGEGTWMVENIVIGSGGTDALVGFFGPARLASEMSLDLLFEDYLWHDDYGPALQAALPSERRDELNARLHALVDKSSDPEEVAWLRAKFPTFFN